MDGVNLDLSHVSTAPEQALGTVLQLHGLGSDKEGGGLFTALTHRLAMRQLSAVQMSFRGHGTSTGDRAEVTCTGQANDVLSALDAIEHCLGAPLFIVAASFAAVPTYLVLARRPTAIAGLVLWNPLLDIHGTFTDPTTPWARRNFNSEQQASLSKHGLLTVAVQLVLV
ncbi:MAG: alpha/beta hydrolase [Actinobacteria bacterium]|nr:alpha/beta hydrolase [Actinomycetota bacterium]